MLGLPWHRGRAALCYLCAFFQCWDCRASQASGTACTLRSAMALLVTSVPNDPLTSQNTWRCPLHLEVPQGWSPDPFSMSSVCPTWGFHSAFMLWLLYSSKVTIKGPQCPGL